VITFQQVEAQDFGVLSKASARLDSQGLVLIKGDNRDTTAADSNGSGKTTLFKAISWCLFGEVIRDGKVTDDIIRKGANAAEVGVTFTDDINEYRVVRRRTPSGGSLTLYTDGVSTTGRTAKDTEARIQEVLGLDWPAFRNTVLYGQGDINRFASPITTDKDRKAILKQVLRLDVYDKAKQEASARLKAAKQTAAATSVEVAKAETAVSAAVSTLATNEGLLGQWEARRDADIAELRRQADISDAEAVAIRGECPDIPALEQSLKEAQQEASDAADRADALQAAQSARADTAKEAAAAERALHVAATRASRLHEDVTRLIADAKRLRGEADEAEGRDAHQETCPTCGSLVDAADHVSRLRSAAKATMANAKALVPDLAEATDAEDEAREQVTFLQAEMDKADKVVAHLSGGTSVSAASVQVDVLRRRLEAAQQVEARAQACDDKAKADRAAADSMEGSVNDELRDALLKAADNLADAQSWLSTAQSAHQEAQDAIRPLEWWRDTFGDKGLPSLAMDNVMPILTEAANRHLDILADGDIQVEITSETALKGGGFKDSIDIVPTIEGHTGVTPSGGQEAKISLATNLALMDVVAAREGAEINLMLLDEVLDGLDAEGKARVAVLLQEMRKTRSSLFVVSHDDAIQEHFERIITVVKKGGKSTLEAS
jgi:DNA repair exonuclease SbcCD ATPase subunit